MNKTTTIALVGFSLLSPGCLWAKSEVYNSSDRTVAVLFDASECVSVRTLTLSSCSAGAAVETNALCQESTIAPGEMAEYKFDKDFTGKGITAAWCEGTDEVTVREDNLGGDRNDHRCVVQKDTSTAAPHQLKIRCGYSKKAFKSIRKRPILGGGDPN